MKRYILLVIFVLFIVSCGGDDTGELYPDLAVDEDSATDDSDEMIKDTGHYAVNQTLSLPKATLGNVTTEGDTLLLAATKEPEALLYAITSALKIEKEEPQKWGKWSTFQTVVSTEKGRFLGGDWQPEESDIGEGNIFISDGKGGDIHSTLAATGSVTIYAACAIDDDFIVGGRLSGNFEGEESAGGTDAFVARISPEGETVWVHQFGGAELDSVQGVAILKGGNILAVGNSGKGDYLHGFMVTYTPDGEQKDFTILEESRHLWEVVTGSFLTYMVGDTMPDDDGIVSATIYFVAKTGAISKNIVASVGSSSHATGVAVKKEFIYITGFAVENEGDPLSAFLLTLSSTGDEVSHLFFGEGAPSNPKVALLKQLPVVSTTIRDGENSMIMTTSFLPVEEE